jgi:MFS family permease|tara:strand:+ start:117 stop:1301 length:1185 start_codon:yes stop_codon:yes gene_type:complete
VNAFSHRAFNIYFFTNTFSLLGIWVQKVGLGWLAWQITESTFWTSLVALSIMAPAGILGPVFAVYAERWDMRRAMLLAKSIMTLVSILIFILQIFEMHSLQSLLILSFVLGVLNAIHHPIRLVFISLIVPRPYLPSAIGLNSVSWSMSRIVGPGIAGISIATFGLGVTFGLAALLFLPFIIALIWLPLQNRQNGNSNTEKFLTRLGNGWMVVLNTPIIFMCLSIVALNSFFIRGVLEIQPAIIGQVLGGDSKSLAIATAATGVGSVIASGWIGAGKLSQEFIRRTLWPGLILGLIAILTLIQAIEIVSMSIVFIICGFTTTLVGIGSQTIIQLKVEDHYRARVLAWWSSVSFGGLTLGGLLIGLIGDFTSISTAIFFVGVLGLILATASISRLK